MTQSGHRTNLLPPRFVGTRHRSSGEEIHYPRRRILWLIRNREKCGSSTARSEHPWCATVLYELVIR